MKLYKEKNNNNFSFEIKFKINFQLITTFIAANKQKFIGRF